MSRNEEFQSGHRMSHQPDLDGPGMHEAHRTYPGIYENPQWYTHGEQSDRESLSAIRKTRNKPDASLRIYRAVPPGVTDISPGDWVTPSRTYAREHGMHPTDSNQDMPVISMMVPAKHVVEGSGNSINEWGYRP
jgi:hypothetical protein